MKNKLSELEKKLELWRVAAEAAHYYYVEGLSQKIVAGIMGIGQTDVSNHVKFARENNIVQFNIDYSTFHNIKDKLCSRFKHLNDVVISPIGISNDDNPTELTYKELGEEAARFFIRRIPSASSIGIGCGKTLGVFIDSLTQIKYANERLPEYCSFFPLAILRTPEVRALSPAVLVANLVRLIPKARGQAFHIPIMDTIAKAGMKGNINKEIRSLISKIEKCQYIMIGVGGIDFNHRTQIGDQNEPRVEFNDMALESGIMDELRKNTAAGETAYRPFSSDGVDILNNGGKVFDKFHQMAFTTSIEVLQERVQKNDATVIAIAGGTRKHQAIHAALKSKIFNVLITDYLTAEYLVKEENIPLEAPKSFAKKLTQYNLKNKISS